jgi:hypothetical protein
LSGKNRLFPAVLVVILFTDSNENIVIKQDKSEWVLPAWKLEGGKSWLDTVESAGLALGLKNINPKLVGICSSDSGDSGFVSCVFEIKGCSSQLPLGYEWASWGKGQAQLNGLDAEIIKHFIHSPTDLMID